MNKHLHLQENRNTLPTMTVCELMTIYLFGHINGHFKKRHIYTFTKNYWADWFPNLPSYQAFNRRLNLLEPMFQVLFKYLLEQINYEEKTDHLDYLIDSVPIILAHGTRSKRARVAPDVAAVGFCATKQTNFHGVRLHLIAKTQPGHLPKPSWAWLREGGVHDLTALKEQSGVCRKMTLFADKAYVSKDFKQKMQTQETEIVTPTKKPKKKQLSKDQRRYNRLVSSIRQPIESLFKWLIDKTDIQRASAVRSTNGLLVHCIGKLSFALFLLTFYY